MKLRTKKLQVKLPILILHYNWDGALTNPGPPFYPLLQVLEMSKRLLEYDPVTGISTWFDGDGHNGFKVAQTQDVQPILERNKRLANDESYKRKGIKEDWYHFATVPVTVLHEILMKYNLDWANKDDLPKIEKILQRDYKKLLTVSRV